MGCGGVKPNPVREIGQKGGCFASQTKQVEAKVSGWVLRNRGNCWEIGQLNWIGRNYLYIYVYNFPQDSSGMTFSNTFLVPAFPYNLAARRMSPLGLFGFSAGGEGYVWRHSSGIRFCLLCLVWPWHLLLESWCYFSSYSHQHHIHHYAGSLCLNSTPIIIGVTTDHP